MEIRFFQILVPIVAILFIYSQFSDYKRGRSSIYESMIIGSFWISVVALSLFPDLFSQIIAKLFGIKSNINAVIFFALGILFYAQFKMYKLIKRQDEVLTRMARKIALDEHDKN